MISADVKVVGAAELGRALKTAPRRVLAAARERVIEAAALIEADAKRNIQGSRTRAIREGLAPTVPDNVLAVDTGFLRRSITTEIFDNGSEVGAIVGPRGPYARIHELGGQAGRGGATTIRARPYLGPAVDKNLERIIELVGKAFEVV